jgi:hypothetical protein
MRGHRRIPSGGRARRHVVLALVVSATLGCATASNRSAQAPGSPESARASQKVTVYFYSMPGWVDPAGQVWILEGGTLVAALESDSYAVAHLSPGEHWLRSWETTARAEDYEYDCFEFDKGREYSVLLERDGRLTASPGDAGLRRLLEERPELQRRQVSPELAAIARRTVDEFPAARGPSAEAEPAGISPSSGEKDCLVPAGAEVALQLMENVSTFNTKAGEPLLFEVEEDTSLGEGVTVPRGLIVEGIVRTAARPGAAGLPGRMEIEIFRLVLPSGDVVPLRAALRSQGQPSAAANTLGELGTSSLRGAVESSNPFGLGLSFLFLMSAAAVRGHEAWLPAGTRVVAAVRRDIRVSSTERPAPQQPDLAPAAASVAASSMGPVVIPASARVASDWSVRLETRTPPLRIWITSVGDLPPPHAVGPSRISPHGEWQEVRFPAWAVVRFAILDPLGTARIPVILQGVLADGSAFVVSVEATVQVEPAH